MDHLIFSRIYGLIKRGAKGERQTKKSRKHSKKFATLHLAHDEERKMRNKILKAKTRKTTERKKSRKKENARHQSDEAWVLAVNDERRKSS